ncbi:hypothetical protein STCU_08969 [Strigomonas culicis]|uniref:Uncharacterized protein n=1 Tax=Strigomonas culicis TaxID=28005 RepID=S9V0R5_9TRYP|nr:hypothetical protein STCU_08969 [Strigomonas culicis]|eukprot:EPY20501.1 hypothetical protein STCU_08969 [Strigomonas culicis]
MALCGETLARRPRAHTPSAGRGGGAQHGPPAPPKIPEATARGKRKAPSHRGGAAPSTATDTKKRGAKPTLSAARAVPMREAAALLLPHVRSHLQASAPLLWAELQALAQHMPPASHPTRAGRDGPHTAGAERYLQKAIALVQAPLDLRRREAWSDGSTSAHQQPLYVDVLVLTFIDLCARGPHATTAAATESLYSALRIALPRVLASSAAVIEARKADGGRYAAPVPSWCSEALSALLSVLFALRDRTRAGGDTAPLALLQAPAAAVVSTLSAILEADRAHLALPENPVFHSQTVQRHVDRFLQAHRGTFQSLPTHDVSGSLYSVMASEGCVSHMMWLLHAAQHVLAAFETPTGAAAGEAPSAPPLPEDPSGALSRLLKQHVVALEALWHAATPFAQQRHAADRLLHHRTCHAVLNIKLAHYAEERSAMCAVMQRREATGTEGMWPVVRQVRLTSTTPLWCYAPAKASGVIQRLRQMASVFHRTVSQTDGFHAALHRSPAGCPPAEVLRYWVPLHCIWIRTALAVELDLSFSVAHALGEQLCAPSRLDVATERDTEEPTSSGAGGSGLAVGAARAQWQQIAADTVALRVLLAELTSEAFSVYVGRELVADGAVVAAEGRPRPTTLFLQMVRTLWFPLARRHYLAAAHRQRLPCYREADTRRLMEAFLSVFLLQRSISPPFEVFLAEREGAEGSPSSETGAALKRYVPVCGTTLSQAMEVSFFLGYFVTYLHRTTTSDVLFSHAAVESYLKEMFYFLDVNTAKQLWHLRREKKLFFFTGEQRHHQLTEDEALQRRLAMSTLVTVHAHVTYASVLWMPLYQLQELFFLLLQFPQLFFGPSRTLLDTTSAGAAAAADGEGDEADAFAWSMASDPAAAAAPAGSSQKVQGAPVRARRRVHGYLVLRLYVISNVLRTLGELALSRELAALAHTPQDRAAAGSLSASIERLLAYEPPAARQRRHSQSRPWAAAQARILHTECSRLPAEVEGIPSVSGGYVRVLQRVETTARSALDHGLLFDVSRWYGEESRQQRRRVSADGVTSEADGGPAAAAGALSAADESVPQTLEGEHRPVQPLPSVVTLQVSRVDGAMQLGFVMDSATCCIRSVQAALELASAGPTEPSDAVPLTAVRSPFAAAAGAAGVADPQRLVGYTVAAVNGVAVRDGGDVVRLLKHSLSFRLELRGP